MRPSDSPLAHQPEPESTGAEEDAVPAAPHRTTVENLLVAALVVIAVLLLAIFLAIRALTIETKRVACYERLHFITESALHGSTSAPATGTARLCEGSDPLIEYRIRASEPPRP